MGLPLFHWKREPVDARDKIYKPTAIVLPKTVDLRQYCSPIEDQGQLGSCTGNAIAGLMECLNRKAGKTVDVSRLFIYYEERVLEGSITQDAGAYIRDGIKTCYKYGAPLEELWPYLITKFKTPPNSSAVRDAANRKVTLYERILDHDGCLDAISNGYPVIIGFDVYQSFMSNTVARTGVMPYPNTNKEVLLGGHAVLLVGYNKTKQQYIVRNSWGTNWGDKGYFYMPFKVIQNSTMSDDFWVIKSVNNP